MRPERDKRRSRMKATVVLANIGRFAIAYWFIETLAAVWFFLFVRYDQNSLPFFFLYSAGVLVLYFLSVWLVGLHASKRSMLSRLTVFACLVVFAALRLALLYIYIFLVFPPLSEGPASLYGG
jgi:hypothetical protein